MSNFELKRDGAILGCQVEGQGMPVLVVGSSRYYPRTFSPALREYCRMAFLDLRHFAAHEGEPDPASITLGAYRDDIEAARKALGFEQFVLIGHSHHGNLAMEYASHYPQRVSRLVLIGSPPCNVADTLKASEAYWHDCASPERKARLDQRRATLDEEKLASLPLAEAFVTRYVTDAPLYWNDPTYDGAWLWQDVPINPTALAGFKTFFSDYDFSRTAASLTMPVLVVMGKQDFIVPPTMWERLESPFKSMSYHRLERSGHTPQLEEPERFNGLLLDWLSE